MRRKKWYFGRQSISLLILLLISFYQCFSQVALKQFPSDNQILQRDDNDDAIIPVSGTVSSLQRGILKLKVWQENALFYESEINLTGQTQVDFNPKIKAGQHNYYIKLYFNDQVIKTADRVVSGDIYFLYGQSNAMGYSGINEYTPQKSVFLRYYVMNNYENKDGEWLVPFETSRWPGTGLFPLELERILLENFQYPIGLIVGAVGGSNILNLGFRNQQNPFDIYTDYGKALTQIAAGSRKEQIKYMIFRHGESDASDSSFSEVYPQKFTTLINYFKADLPNLKKIYNFQTNILIAPNPRAGFLREFQRNSSDGSSLITNISTMGTKGYDGLHYSTEGYRQTATELARILGKEIYGKNESPEIYSPDLKIAYWKGDQLVLEFDENFKMTSPRDTIIHGRLWSMKDFIYIDGKSGVVSSISSSENKIFLNLTTKGTSVSYLPPFYGSETDIPGFYEGPNFTNFLGMRAFSFDNVKIRSRQIEIEPDSGPLSIYTNQTPKCASTRAEVYFTTSKKEAGQYFKAQLSDANGIFTSGKIIGEGKTSPIIVTIPEDTKAGSGYRIRLLYDYRTNNLLTDSFTVNLKATVMISTKNSKINSGEEAGISLSFTGTPPFDFMLSDSTWHSTTNYEVDFFFKLVDNTSYSVLEVKNICGTGESNGLAQIELRKMVLANEVSTPDVVSVFPNPAIDYFIINVNSTAQVDFRLYDAKGKHIIETNFYGNHKIAAKDLVPGMYYYRIKNGESVKSGKIVIQ